MKRFITHSILLLFGASLFIRCDFKDKYDTSAHANFNFLWKIIDENYCFFEFKDIDWDQVYEEYNSQIHNDMDEFSLFFALSEMLNELKDGHVNLLSDNNQSGYDGWWNNYPINFDINLIFDNYLEWGHRSFDDIVYITPLKGHNIGYICYRKFTESILESELNQIFEEFRNCEGIIIDVRSNGGGSLTNSDRLAARFFHKKTLCGYIQHKTGKGRNDFSDPYPIYIEPSHAELWPSNKPVMVLTNRKCYSATNNFISKMKVLPNVTTIGDYTGGGSGFPFSSELPNGWGVRFSTSPILDVNKKHTEFGIAPDIEVSFKDPEEIMPVLAKDKTDPIIEEAIKRILSK